MLTVESLIAHLAKFKPETKVLVLAPMGNHEVNDEWTDDVLPIKAMRADEEYVLMFPHPDNAVMINPDGSEYAVNEDTVLNMLS